MPLQLCSRGSGHAQQHPARFDRDARAKKGKIGQRREYAGEALSQESLAAQLELMAHESTAYVSCIWWVDRVFHSLMSLRYSPATTKCQHSDK